ERGRRSGWWEGGVGGGTVAGIGEENGPKGPPLQTLQRTGRGRRRRGRNPSRLRVNMGNNSRGLDYCQGIVPQFYHSNETRGSRGDRRVWREICSLVRQ